MTDHTFSSQVSWNISSSGSGEPGLQSHDSDSYKKKRSSGLELLRPKSSHGSARNAIVSPTHKLSPMPMSALPVPPVPDHDPNWNKEGFVDQRATLRHTRSIPHLQPVTLDDEKGKRPTRWRSGRVEIKLEGKGGSQGGLLTIYDGEDTVFRQQLKPLPQHTWACDDIQQVHTSVYDRANVLSLRLPHGEMIVDSKRTSRSKGLNMSALSKLGRRARGYTINRMDSTSTSTSASTNESTNFGSEVSESIESQPSESDGTERLVLLAFPSLKATWEWYALFRSFGGRAFPRTHRRLQIRLLDIQETVPLSTQLTREETSSTQLKISSVDESSGRSSEAPKSIKERVKAGWAGREKLRVEIWLDNQVFGRTTWARAEEGSCIPFWGELFTFEEIPEFSSCVLKICRLQSGKSQAFATVAVPLVSTYQKVRDERYPVKSLSSSGMIGEVRMIVSYQSVSVISGHEYVLPEVFWGMGGTRTIYYLVARGDLDQTMDLFTRFNWGIGTTLQRLYEMAEIEARASGETLFRSNTPLTRLLEATMRLVCADFLRLSIGRTVTTILEHGVEVNHEDLRVIQRIVRDCWQDMYTQRGSFPNIVRLVFAKLFQSVKENHEERKLHYKAVSSFLFLRLIGPALMRPHLFCLAAGLPPAAVQRTLTLVAKVFHAMAFFTHSDTARDPELRKFSEFLGENDDMMVDYLSSFATPLDAFQARPPRPTPIETFLQERVEIMPVELAEGVPKLTVAGPVEMSGDGAIFWEFLYQRRRSVIAGHNPREAAGGDDELEMLIRTMDRFLLGVHRQSHRQQAFLHQERSSTPRPSLQIDVTAAKQDWNYDRELQRDAETDRNPDPARNRERGLEVGSIREREGDQKGKGLGSSGRARVASPATWKWLNFGWMSPTFPHGYGHAHAGAQVQDTSLESHDTSASGTTGSDDVREQFGRMGVGGAGHGQGYGQGYGHDQPHESFGESLGRKKSRTMDIDQVD